MLVNLRNHKNRNQELNTVLKAINLSTTIKDLFQISLNKILEFLSAERGSILLLDLTNKELTLKIARGQEENLNYLGDIKQKIGEGIAGIVAQERKPILVKNINKDRRFKHNHNRLNHYKTSSFLSVPLFMKDALIGVINITDKTSKKTFSQEEMDYLLIISDCISFVFERIKLLEEIKTQKEKIERLSFDKSYLDKQLNLAKKFASLGKISSGIAHEINNPLDGVIRYTNLCLERFKDGEVVKEYLSEVKGGLHRITNIIRSFLEFSRHRNTTIKSIIDINKVIDESLTSIAKNISLKNNITVTRKYSQDLPEIIDKGIKHVFTNLIKNAYEAMADDGGILTIDSRKNNEFIEVRIRDTGCGIPQENIPRIFEPFFTTKPIEKGSGLGLAMCYDIIERYNGNIGLESKPGQGTTFTISIPLEASPNE
ncbi:MAG: ATP-binding protein [Candidatus Omnitrophota bacterium]